MAKRDLSAIFLASCGSSPRKSPGLESLLREAIEQATRAWPRVEVESQSFAAYLGQRLTQGRITEESLAHVADLYLACACLHQDTRALANFETHFLSRVREYVASVDGTEAFVDEVKQLLRQKLFVKSGESEPKIGEYGGRGPLGGWLRVVAIRAARNLMRAQKSHRPLDAGARATRDASPDPELSYLRRRYAREFAQAFQKTLAALSSTERNMLSLYFLEGLSSDAIGKLYRKSGQAIRLAIKRCRKTLLAETHALLKDRLGAKPSELRSLFQLVKSELDVSIGRYLKP